MSHDMTLVVTCPLRHFIFLNLKKKKKKFDMGHDMSPYDMTFLF